MYKRTKIEAEVHPRFLCLEEFMNYTGLGRGSAMKCKRLETCGGNKTMRSHCRSSGRFTDSDCTGIHP